MTELATTIFMTCSIDAFPIFLLVNYPLPAINCFLVDMQPGIMQARIVKRSSQE